MRIKMIKPHPVTGRYIGGGNAYNPGATIKAMNLVVQGYAELLHSCNNCNPYHIELSEISKKDYSKPFKHDLNWYNNKKTKNCIYKEKK